MSFVTLLPVQDAAASALGRPFEVETLVASSTRAAELDGAQIDLGEGPGWSAYRSLRPVSMRVDDDREIWPFFASTLTRVGVCSVLAVPLLVGTLSIGAVSLYSDAAVQLEAEQLRLATNLSTLLARSVVARALDEADSGVVVRDPSLSRREVHQATGMVIAQTGSTPDEALLTIRVYSYTSGLSVRDVAGLIVARQLDFSPDRGGTDPKVG
ncbi:ANTAR domain-containing protein [Rathayibacter sp. VKM Ac-2759]|uniref:GAF and ANTAR domain-containing protein n=1 Tax=Rathayibacter sp. VKM Ac-2759 TaxID=2609252 RepID=UPI001316AFB6|nr:GAF and ANTAR domain-containing protein [Rathayibacter sp. VKM Ac-2759]QHC65756.1 ANTAR domain-containing protein [Rathayibacter sp. VKM Ac-2759]